MKIDHYNRFMELASKITVDATVRGNTAGIEWRYEANKSLLKHLNEYGILDVATVQEIGWGYGGPSRTYYWISISQKGIDLLTGKIPVSEIEKPCTCDKRYYPACKQHGGK